MNMTKERIEALIFSVLLIGVVINGFRTGKMPGNPFDPDIPHQNKLGFWMFAALWIGLACVATYVGFFEATP